MPMNNHADFYVFLVLVDRIERPGSIPGFSVTTVFLFVVKAVSPAAPLF